jgi:hypothetical protein
VDQQSAPSIPTTAKSETGEGACFLISATIITSLSKKDIAVLRPITTLAIMIPQRQVIAADL